MKPAKDSTIIPRRPLLWLAAALLFLVPTMLGNLAIWVPIIFLGTLLAKFWMEKKDRRLRSTVWKIVLAISGLGAVIATYGSPAGLEPGTSLLVLLASLKILEAHTARDFHVLVMLGWVLCLCGFIMSQTFLVALCILIAFVLLLTALVQFHRRGARGGAFWPPLAAAGRLLLQASPLVVILFLLFPRGTGQIRLFLPGALGNSTGFSGTLSPGTVASIATSDEIAFRAEFPDGNMPPRSTLYWRGAVLWEGGGLAWQAGQGLGKAQELEGATGESVRQRITMEPHAGKWLFALDRPLTAPQGATLAPGRYLHSPRPITRIRRYEVVSAPRATESELRPRERTAFLRLPVSVTPEARALAQSFAAEDDDPRAVVMAALEYFRTQGFVYSLAPGEYEGEGAAALDDFLFRRKSGFCEHYAGAFVTLMRAARVPSRVVVGYLGGELNQFGGYLLVRQSDAHAWCEVWIPGSGWQRVDPTSVIAPERASLGSLREMRAAAAQKAASAEGRTLPRASALARVVDEARLAWDTVSFAWDTHVLSFDLDAQSELLTQLRIGDWSGGVYLLGIAALIIGLLGAYALWLRRSARSRPDALRALYDQFCLKAEALGAPRRASEGPAHYAERAANLIPAQSDRIQRISETYIALRYSPKPASARLEHLVAEIRAFVRQ